MQLVISIHQPDYIPYMGYFYKMWKSDIFVFLDDVQFSKSNMHHWNRVKTPDGEFRLKIPVEHTSDSKINEVRTRDELKWKEKHLKVLQANYSKAKHFKMFFPQFEALLVKEYSSLAEMNIAINQYICNQFGFYPTIVKSSDLNLSTVKEARNIDICLRLGADTYLSGNGAKAYQVEEHFCEKGIKLCYTDYEPFPYQQRWGDFIPNLSILDYILNEGFQMPVNQCIGTTKEM